MTRRSGCSGEGRAARSSRAPEVMRTRLRSSTLFRRFAREAPQVVDHLPDLLVGEIRVRRHRGARRTEANDPEELSVGDAVERLRAAEVARTRREMIGHDTAAVAVDAVAGGARNPLAAAIELLALGEAGIRRERVH